MDTTAASLPPMLRALRARNYRLFFVGQGVSLIGTWITRIATSWLVYRLTGSVVLLGEVSFCGQVPTLLLAPMAGVWVDRWDRHRTLLVTQVLSMVQSFALAALVFSGHASMPALFVLSAAQGAINAFDMPVRQALVPDMVDDPDDLPNAIALNSSLVNGARVLGPSIGGGIIAAVGEGWCFFLDGVSYLAVIASLLAMHLRPVVKREGPHAALRELGEGFRYARNFAPVRSLLLLVALVSMMGMPYTVLMPDFVSEVLHGGPATLGALMAASGLGALAGALYLAARESILGLGRVIAGAAAVFGLALVGLALARSIGLALALLAVVGGGFMIQLAATNTLLQTLAPAEFRGRVMGFYTTAFFGTTPFGSLFAGFMAEIIGTSATIAAGGIACVLGGLWFASRLPALRAVTIPVYRERGILPPIEP